ncbi:YitT family protein [Clostridium sp. 'White wine YQ']|uniref:YitT family protein n=1 Tax=Clostridium sp. 'White wine YQ' TaxID=3027474 RepID=UPI00236588C4|nr:YitT family protein [Clostridium sp. 'White wine YQ']MDD7795969.1 YitT family protein [Clostridium sp. 'White wine YQ']
MEFIRDKKNLCLDILLIFIGCLIASLGVNIFLANAKLLSGGATGLALIIQYFTGFKAGYSVFLLNLPLFVISYFKLSKQFTLYSAIGMISLTISLLLTERIHLHINIDDLLVYCIYGGALCGIGYSIVFLRNGSTGGTDIITMLIRKKYSNFDIGTVGFSINVLIVILGAIFFGLPRALYTLISIYLQNIILDKVLKGFGTKKLLMILTEKEEDVIKFIMTNLHRGVTSLNAEGEYTHHKKKMIYCIVTLPQLVYLKSQITSIDPKSFITIIDVSEVRGRGFKNL